MTKLTEQERTYHRELIWENVLELFRKKNLTQKSIIKSQKKFINSLNIIGKNKYKSIEILNNYFNNPNKLLAEQIFYNTLYKKLTHYGNLVLLSDGEADPLVVKEALNAGLGIVISECAQANLDITLPFIDVIPDDKRDDISYVEEVINDNRKRSIPLRQQIKEYANNEFSWDVIIDKYCNLCIYKNDL